MAVQKQSFTPIMLQGSNHWKTVVLMDLDYNITKLNFDRFSEGFIPRLLFVRKKFSSEINKASLQRLYKKRRMISEADITPAELDKMLGNHLFKFFYKVLQQFARGSHNLGHDDLVYLGQDPNQLETARRQRASAGISDEESNRSNFHFDCTELLEVYYGVLEENAPFFVHEYLHYLMIGAHGDLNPFHLLRDLFAKSTQGVDDLRLLSRFYAQATRDGRSTVLKSYEANLYKLKNYLETRLTFTEEEVDNQTKALQSLKVHHRLPESGQFRKMSEAGRLAVKLKLNEVALPTLALKVAAHCKAVVEQLASELKQDRSRVAEVLADSQLIKDSGLGQLIKPLVDN